MPRNLDRRVELMFPIEDEDCRSRIKEILDVEINDTIRATYLLPDGNYHKLDLRGKVKLDSQQELIRLADEAVAGRMVEEERLAFEPAVAPD